MHHCLIVLFLLTTQLVFAQANSPAKVSYRITSLATIQGESYSNTRGGDLLKISKMHVSNPVKAVLREGGFLDFFEEKAAADVPPSFSVRIPQASLGGDLLVILLSKENKTKPLLLDLKALKIPRGGQYVFNLLPVPIAVRCGKGSKPVVVPQHQQKIIPAPLGSKVVQSFYYSDQKGKTTRFSSSLYFKDLEARQIIFCYQKQGNKFPKLAPIIVYKQRSPKPG